MKKEKHSLNISLLGDKVLVLPENIKLSEQKTTSGIIVPVKEDPKIEMGKIVAIGNGRKANDGSRIPLDVKIDDRVYFKRGYDTEEVELLGVKYIMLSESNVYAIIG